MWWGSEPHATCRRSNGSRWYEVSIGGIVFARMNSSRLPGKALLPIGEQPLLGWVLRRAARAKGPAQVVVATSTDPSDDQLVAFVRSAGVPVYRGALENVAARALGCAREFGFIAFVRICGDRLFLEPTHIEAAIARFIESAGEVDVVTNTFAGTVPPGLTTEVVRTEALANMLEQTSDPQDLEHVTRYFYAHAGQFRITTGGTVPSALNGLRFVVDTSEDLERARYIVARLADPARAPIAQVAALARAWDQQRHEYCDA
jgi:spore coat polysaccharide biosynthesis protein SpsF (cytidylyltransferase family)